MALKRSDRQVDYVSQISVNRGSGFSDMAEASRRSAAIYENTTERIAGKLLSEMQRIGTEAGEDAANEVQFTKENVAYYDPRSKTTKYSEVYTQPPLYKAKTKSEADAYEEIITRRHLDLLSSDFQSIIDEEERIAITNGETGQQFLDALNPRLFVTSVELPPKTRNWMESEIAKRKQSSFNNVEKNRIALNKANMKSMFDLDINNISNVIELQSGLKDISKVNQAFQKLESILQLYAEADPTATTPEKITETINTLRSYSNLLLSLPNKPDLNSTIAERRAYSQSLENVLSVLNSETTSAVLPDGSIANIEKYNDLAKGSLGALDSFKSYVKNSTETFNAITASEIKDTLNSNKAKLNEQAFGSGNPLVNLFENNDADRTWLDSYIQSDDFVSYVSKTLGIAKENLSRIDLAVMAVQTNNLLPETEYRQIQAAFQNGDPDAIQEFFSTNGLLTRLVEHSTDPTENGMAGLVYFEQGTKSEIMHIYNRISAGMDVGKAVESLLTNREVKDRNLRDYISRDYSDYNNDIFELMEKFGKSRLGSSQMDALFGSVFKAEVETLIKTGNVPVNDRDDLRTIVNLVGNEMLSSVGKQQFGLSETTISQIFGQEKDYGEPMLVRFPAEQIYGLPKENGKKSLDWAYDILNEKISTSAQMTEPDSEFVQNEVKLEFGKNVLLYPIDGLLSYDRETLLPSVNYYLIYADNGLYDYLDDVDGDAIIVNFLDKDFDFVKKAEEYDESILELRDKQEQDARDAYNINKQSQHYQGTMSGPFTIGY